MTNFSISFLNKISFEFIEDQAKITKCCQLINSAWLTIFKIKFGLETGR
jgi:hypothetical protein